MAIVGEARIIVRAITTGVGEEISRAMKNAERGIASDGKSMGKTFGDSINNGMRKSKWDFGGDEAIKASDSWAHLQRTGMTLQVGISSLIGSISALVGGFGALIGAAGAASTALVAVGGAAVGLGIGMKLAGMALGGIGAAFNKATGPGRALKKTLAQIREEMQQLRFDAEEAALSEKDAALNLEKARNNLARMQDLPPNSMARREAELELEKADLAYRKAKDRTKDLNDQIKNGGKDVNAGGGNDPYAGLTKSQKDFAKALVALKPKFDALKEAVASGFLPALRTQIETMMGKNFPTLEAGFRQIGTALGTAVTQVGTFINSTKGMSNLKSIFDTSSTVISTFGTALASALEAFTDILRVASPLTKKFVEWIASKADTFRNFIINKEATGELQHFFDRAGELAGKFGKIFGNIFKGIGKIIGANFEKGSGGDRMLDWLIQATDKFANLDRMVGGSDALNKYFGSAVTNTKSILGSIGALVKEMLSLGTMPEIQQFWDTLKAGAPAAGEIMRAGVKASPALAGIVTNLTKITAVFADATQLKIFFGILEKITGALAKMFENETVKRIASAVGAVAAVGLAFGLVQGVAVKFAQVFTGLFMKLTGSTAQFAKMWGGPILLGIALVIGAFSNLYSKNDEFKKQVDEFVGKFQTLFSGLSASFSTLGPELNKFFDIFSESLMPIFVLLMDTLVDLFPYIQQLADILFKDLLPVVLNVAGILLQSLVPAISSILSAIMPLIPIILNSLMPVITLLAEAFGMLMPQIATLVAQLVNALAPVITSLIGVITPVIAIVVELVSSFAQMLIPIIMVVVEVVMMLMPIITGIITVFADLATIIFSVVGPALNIIVQVLTFLARLITGVVVAAVRLLLPIFSGVFSGISIGVKAMQDGFKWAMNQMIGFAEGFINFFIDGLNWIFSMINKIKIDIPEALRPLVGGMKSLGFNIQPMQRVRLARLAEGGTVFPSQGGSIVNVAEAGRPERIEPLDANGLSKRDLAMIKQLSGNGMQIVVNAAPGMNEKELAEVVSRRLAFEMRKGSI